MSRPYGGRFSTGGVDQWGCYKQLFPPTGVDHSVSCKFTNGDELELVVACTNLLEVYSIHDGSFGDNKLALEASYPLFGNVESMCPVKIPSKGICPFDALAITFTVAKVHLPAATGSPTCPTCNAARPRTARQNRHPPGHVDIL